MYTKDAKCLDEPNCFCIPTEPRTYLPLLKREICLLKRDPVYAFLVLLFGACSIIYITAYAIINLFQLCIERGYSMFECVRRVTVVEHCKWLCTSESRKWNVLLPHCFLGECIFHVRAFCSSQLKNWCPVQTQRFKSVGISWSA